MDVLGIRFCSVSNEAESLARFLEETVGLSPLPISDGVSDEFPGAIFGVGDSSIEVWKDGPSMPAGIMLQLVVKDADAWAASARARGGSPQGPIDAHGERIYYLRAPGGLPLTVQSRLPDEDLTES